MRKNYKRTGRDEIKVTTKTVISDVVSKGKLSRQILLFINYINKK
jgi:hypothetical protein